MSLKAKFDLTGRRALITGSSRGIGRAMAIALAEYGADVAVHYASRTDEAEVTASAARAFGGKVAIVGGDLSQPGASRRVLEAAATALGGSLDIVVANAAIQTRQEVWEEDLWAEGRAQIDANFLSILELIQSAVPPMREKGWGRIVTIGSVQQARPHPKLVVYAALKSGLLNLVRNLALQLSRTGVTINNLAPGAIATDRNAEVLADPKYREWVESRIPMGFVGETEDCTGALLLLCSDAGRYITGADIFVDGGMGLG